MTFTWASPAAFTGGLTSALAAAFTSALLATLGAAGLMGWIAGWVGVVAEDVVGAVDVTGV